MNFTGLARCGASRFSASDRSFNASNTNEKFSCSKYRSPPWNSLLDRLDVPAAKSRASTNPTRRPRVTASSAAPAPVTPAPITRTSSSSVASRASDSRRVSGLSGAVTDVTVSPISHRSC
jgi:hypothetical protein